MPGRHCPLPSVVRERPGLSQSSVSGGEAVVCETESPEVGPDPNPAVAAKPAVPAEDSRAPSYEEKHP